LELIVLERQALTSSYVGTLPRPLRSLSSYHPLAGLKGRAGQFDSSFSHRYEPSASLLHRKRNISLGCLLENLGANYPLCNAVSFKVSSRAFPISSVKIHASLLSTLSFPSMVIALDRSNSRFLVRPLRSSSVSYSAVGSDCFANVSLDNTVPVSADAGNVDHDSTRRT